MTHHDEIITQRCNAHRRLAENIDAKAGNPRKWLAVLRDDEKMMIRTVASNSLVLLYPVGTRPGKLRCLPRRLCGLVRGR